MIYLSLNIKMKELKETIVKVTPAGEQSPADIVFRRRIK